MRLIGRINADNAAIIADVRRFLYAGEAEAAYNNPNALARSAAWVRSRTLNFCIAEET